MSYTYDPEEPVVKTEWVQSLISDYVETTGQSRFDLGLKAHVNLRRLYHMERNLGSLTSMSVADRIWIGTGHTGPFPKEAWARDDMGRKLKGKHLKRRPEPTRHKYKENGRYASKKTSAHPA